jgi:hypothetical protein
LGANLDAQGRNISSVGNIDATGVTGNFYGSVYSVTSGLTLINANNNEINLSSTSISSLKDVSIDTATIQLGQSLIWDGFRFIASNTIDDGSGFSVPNNFNFGEIFPTANTVAEFIFYQTEFDFGTFNNPNIINIDLGSI